MYAPTRGGTRGGQGDFKWSDVKEDEHRENYLGHSLNAPKGRWQNGKDITWYLKPTDGDAAERAEEMRKIKEAEEDALSVALGFAPTPRLPPPPPVDPNQLVLQKAQKEREKAERKREREERRAERAARKGDRRHGEERHHRSRDDRSRSPAAASTRPSSLATRDDERYSSRRRDDEPREARRRDDGGQRDDRGSTSRGDYYSKERERDRRW